MIVGKYPIFSFLAFSRYSKAPVRKYTRVFPIVKGALAVPPLIGETNSFKAFASKTETCVLMSCDESGLSPRFRKRFKIADISILLGYEALAILTAAMTPPELN